MIDEMTRQASSEQDDESKSLSEQTPIRTSLVIGVLIYAVSSAIAGAWWASRISAKLDSMESQLSSITLTNENRQKEMSDVRAELRVIETSGSPQVAVLTQRVNDNQERLRIVESQGSPTVIARITALENEFSAIKQDFEVYKATHNGTGTKSP